MRRSDERVKIVGPGQVTNVVVYDESIFMLDLFFSGVKRQASEAAPGRSQTQEETSNRQTGRVSVKIKRYDDSGLQPYCLMRLAKYVRQKHLRKLKCKPQVSEVFRCGSMGICAYHIVP